MAKKKYKFAESFIDPETGLPYSGVNSPRFVETREFGKIELHQIAKIKYEEIDSGGQKVVVEKKGETGGWIESGMNLSQSGECWVEEGAVVCQKSVVSGSATIEGKAEIGGSSRVHGEAVVKGKAVVKGRSSVYGNAEVDGNSVIDGMSAVTCIVRGDTEIDGEARVLGSVDSEGKSVIEDSKIGGKARLTGHFTVKESEIGGNTVVVGGKIDDKVVIKGYSYVNGVVKGPVELEDVTVTGYCGEVGGLEEYFRKQYSGSDSDVRGRVMPIFSVLKEAKGFA